MEENKESAKIKLDASKNRLATAFGKLESLIEKNTHNADFDSKEELILLQEKIANINTENQKLMSNFSQLHEDYSVMKLLNTEVLAELNHSINTIENILGSINASDRRNNT
jgi:hypothetical protein